MKTVALIPARKGSERAKLKNLALLNGKPLISYAITESIESGSFDRVIVNSDHEYFLKIAEEFGAEFYLRPELLGSSETKIDDVVYDFILKHPDYENIAIVNPVNPLLTSVEIKSVVDQFFAQNLDSANTVEEKYSHFLFEDKPINFTFSEKLTKTQDLIPVQIISYAVQMWKVSSFKQSMESTGHGVFSGKVGFVPISKRGSVNIKHPDDICMADSILSSEVKEIKYYGNLETASVL